jgi:hypothetical protein
MVAQKHADPDSQHCSKVDIERPEFEAEAYRVFLFRELVMRENLRVTTVQVPLDRHKKFGKLFKIIFRGRFVVSFFETNFL